jgi:hypothetical protein
MICGCSLLDLIEAAHISPYRGERDNHPENGLLLRTDLHTLFDLDLLGIEPDGLTVHLHPRAALAGYDIYQGVRLTCPEEPRPSYAALVSRWSRFQAALAVEGFRA